MGNLPTLEELKNKNKLKKPIILTETKKEAPKKPTVIKKTPIKHKQKTDIENKKDELEELKKYIKGKMMAKKENKVKARVKSPIRDARETIEDLETIENIRQNREIPNMNNNPNILDGVMEKKMADASFDNVNSEHLAYILSQNNNGSVNAVKYRDMIKKIEVIKSITGRESLTKEDLALLLNQMNQQNPQPQQGFDMNNYLMFQLLNKAQNTPKNDKEIEFLKNENLQLREAMRDDRIAQAIEKMGATVQGRESQFDLFKQGMSFAKEMYGEGRAKTETEMKYDLEREKLRAEREDKRDMLAMEQREKEREEEKSNTILQMAGGVMDKIIPAGVGSLIGQLADTFGKSSKKGKKKDEMDDFDPSLLDVL